MVGHIRQERISIIISGRVRERILRSLLFTETGVHWRPFIRGFARGWGSRGGGGGRGGFPGRKKNTEIYGKAETNVDFTARSERSIMLHFISQIIDDVRRARARTGSAPAFSASRVWSSGLHVVIERYTFRAPSSSPSSSLSSSCTCTHISVHT